MAKVLNHDIASLVRRLNRFKSELHKSVSSGVSEISAYDMTRLKAYLNSLSEFKAWMIAQPLLDLPESSPFEQDLGEPAELGDVENDDIDAVLKLLNLLELELVNSQSARLSAGLGSHDAVRFDMMMTKMGNFLNNYVGAAGSLDLPESSPGFIVSGPGKSGI